MNMQQGIKNKIEKKRAEAGQAIVFVALFMVVMLGMLGMAIDGGGLFFLWRDAQGAADSAALSATYAQCAGNTAGQVRARGLETADRNGFRNTDPDHEVRVIVGNDNTSTVLDRATGNMISERQFIRDRLDEAGQTSTPPDNFVRVDILAYKPSFFIQIVYPGPLSVNPAAMSRCNPGQDYSEVPGMLAFGTCGDDTLNFTGSGAYFDGDMHSNEGLKIGSASANSNNGAVFASGTDASYVTNLKDNGINYRGDELEGFEEPTVSATTEIMANPLYNEAEIRDLFGPGGTIAAEIPASDYHYYNSGHTFSSANTTGLHFVEGDASVKFNNGFSVGTEGFTVIATGAIDAQFNQGSSWHYYEGLENRGVPYFAAVSLVNSEGSEDCSKGQAGFKMRGKTGSPSDKDYTTDPLPFSPPSLKGVIYVPYAGFSTSASALSVEGMMIAYMIDFSMAAGAFKQEPDFMPSTPPSVQNVPAS